MAKKDPKNDEPLYLADVLDDVDDIIPAQEDIPAEEDPLALKIINAVTMLLAFLLIGASAVLWWVLLRALLSDPNTLNDPSQMRSLLICSAALPVAVFIAQLVLRRARSIENWLKCMCVAGFITALIVSLRYIIFAPGAVYPLDLKSTAGDIMVVLCCALSGCALPAMICYGIRLIAEKARITSGIKELFRSYDLSDADDAAEWEAVRRDVLALTDFGGRD